MEQPGRTCPKCNSGAYTFRSRKKVERAEGQEAAIETKYRCKACGHEWKATVPDYPGVTAVSATKLTCRAY
jgi:transposase-like protein